MNSTSNNDSTNINKDICYQKEHSNTTQIKLIKFEDTPKKDLNILTRIRINESKIGLSPISEIVNNLEDVAFSPKLRSHHIDNQNFGTPILKKEENEEKNEKTKSQEKDNDLLSNNFTLNSGGRNIAQRQADIRALNIRRRQNVEPFSLSYDDTDVEDEDIGVENVMNENILHENRLEIDEMSFYASQSPHASPRPRSPSPLTNGRLLSPECSPKRFKISSDAITMIDRRRTVNEIDGCSSSSSSSNSTASSNFNSFSFKFTEPQLLRSQKFGPSPCKLPNNNSTMQLNTLPGQNVHLRLHTQKNQNTPPKTFRVFHSLSSTESAESMDEDYISFFEMESIDDETQFPTDLKTLISGDIKTAKPSVTPETKRPLIRRCLSMQESNLMNRVRSAFYEPNTPKYMKSLKDDVTLTCSQQQTERCFKRPEPPTPTMSPSQCKRYKMESSEKENNIFMNKLQETNTTNFYGRPLLRKSMSMNDAQILTALARSTIEPDLIGDFSKPFCLPLMEGRHRDLKSISCETMAKLIHGEFKETVASFKIIDCRYPYEYDGGHIRGAQNLYTHEQILEELVNSKTEAPTVQADGPKRHILVFHCEFSSERGPKLSRFLRNHDRLRNSTGYPALHYPEIYLLHGGYKEFFERYSDLCDPAAYRPMLDPSFGAAYKQFRAKSKSWNGDSIKLPLNQLNRTKKSRSRLVL